MAEMITGTATGFVNNTPEQTLAGLSDIRREAADRAAEIRYDLGQGVNEIVKEGLKGDYATQGNIKDARFDINSRISDVNKEVDNRFFDTGRDLADIRAQIVSAQQQVVSGFLGASKDAELNALKTQVELAKQSTYISDKIDSGNQATQALINSLKEAELNRMLVERNAELVEAVAERRHWRHYADQGQWQALSSQLQAFQSQLQETRQGMVNFGTMAGVGQTSTSNNVR